MEVRPSITVNLNEYGVEGAIRLEPLTLRREVQMKDNIGRCNHYSGNGEELRIDRIDTGSALVYTVMAYITQGPFKTNDIKSFLGFMDSVDEAGGSSSELFKRLQKEIGRIKEGQLSPFAQSDTSPTGTSESS